MFYNTSSIIILVLAGFTFFSTFTTAQENLEIWHHLSDKNDYSHCHNSWQNGGKPPCSSYDPNHPTCQSPSAAEFMCEAYDNQGDQAEKLDPLNKLVQRIIDIVEPSNDILNTNKHVSRVL